MYVRTVYINRPFHRKIDGLFKAINSLEDEKKEGIRCCPRACKEGNIDDAR